MYLRRCRQDWSSSLLLGGGSYFNPFFSHYIWFIRCHVHPPIQFVRPFSNDVDENLLVIFFTLTSETSEPIESPQCRVSKLISKNQLHHSYMSSAATGMNLVRHFRRNFWKLCWLRALQVHSLVKRKILHHLIVRIDLRTRLHGNDWSNSKGRFLSHTSIFHNSDIPINMNNDVHSFFQREC